MKIEKGAVKNYRTIEDIEIVFKEYYTAISGQNNAGKTALIRVPMETFKENISKIYFFAKAEKLKHQEDKTQWVTGGVMKIAPNAPKKILREIFLWKNLYKKLKNKADIAGILIETRVWV